MIALLIFIAKAAMVHLHIANSWPAKFCLVLLIAALQLDSIMCLTYSNSAVSLCAAAQLLVNATLLMSSTE